MKGSEGRRAGIAKDRDKFGYVFALVLSDFCGCCKLFLLYSALGILQVLSNCCYLLPTVP